jgi:hypothetical protein
VPTEINEWEFTADVAKWIAEILIRNPRLPFSEAKCEQRGSDSLKRRDLTLFDKNRVKVLTGKSNLPIGADGGNPYIDSGPGCPAEGATSWGQLLLHLERQ